MWTLTPRFAAKVKIASLPRNCKVRGSCFGRFVTRSGFARIRYSRIRQTKIRHDWKHVSGQGVDPLEEVQIAELLGRMLADRHLLVVENRPAAVLVKVADVVPASRVGPDMADEPDQAVPALPVLQLALCLRPCTHTRAIESTAAWPQYNISSDTASGRSPPRTMLTLLELRPVLRSLRLEGLPVVCDSALAAGAGSSTSATAVSSSDA